MNILTPARVKTLSRGHEFYSFRMVKDLLVYIIMNTVFYRSVEVEKILKNCLILANFANL